MGLRKHKFGRLPFGTTDFGLAGLQRQGNHLNQLPLRKREQSVHKIAMKQWGHMPSVAVG